MLKEVKSIFLLSIFTLFGILSFLYFNISWGVITKPQTICITINLIGIYISMILFACDIVKYINIKLYNLEELLKETERLVDLTIQKSIMFDKNIEDKKETLNELIKTNKEINNSIIKNIQKIK